MQRLGLDKELDIVTSRDNQNSSAPPSSPASTLFSPASLSPSSLRGRGGLEGELNWENAEVVLPDGTLVQVRVIGGKTRLAEEKQGSFVIGT